MLNVANAAILPARRKGIFRLVGLEELFNCKEGPVDVLKMTTNK